MTVSHGPGVTVSEVCVSAQRSPAPAGRWELLRALGSMTIVAPPASDHIAASLGIAAFGAADFTDLFVLSLPPYAGIHLGPDGKLGDEGADRVAGMWRALGLGAPPDADHLGSLLLLYAELGEAADRSGVERTRRRLDHSRAALLWEHLWSWVPGYLDAASAEGDRLARGPWGGAAGGEGAGRRAGVGGAGGGLRSWVDLTRRVLVRETELTPGAADLPLAMRAAPTPLHVDDDYGSVLDALTAPARTGFILTYGDLAEAARVLGLGLRRGERRFALGAMMGQDAAATLTWLSGHARVWADRHRHRPVVAHDPGPWWEQRASLSAEVLAEMARSR